MSEVIINYTLLLTLPAVGLGMNKLSLCHIRELMHDTLNPVIHV